MPRSNSDLRTQRQQPKLAQLSNDLMGKNESKSKTLGLVGKSSVSISFKSS